MMISSGFRKRPPSTNRKPPDILEKVGTSTPPTRVRLLASGCMMVPVATVTCGACARVSTYFQDMGAPLMLSTEVLGGRTTMSAPTPRVRRAESSSSPWLTPIRHKIRVTGTPMSRTLSRLRIGLNSMFSRTILYVTLPLLSSSLSWRRRGRTEAFFRERAKLRSLRLRQRELVGAQTFVDVELDHGHHHRILVARPIEHDLFGKGHAVICLPLAITGVGEDVA